MSRYSKTLVYAPEVQVFVATDNGVLDLSDDIVSGQLRRVVNGVSEFSCVLNNRNRKYIGAMRRMDRIVVFMKRISMPLQVFAGYLDTVPAAGLYATTVSIKASCTLKRLMNTYWDPGLPASSELLRQNLYQAKSQDPKNPQPDSGLGAMMANVLFKVGGWSRDQIHIGNIPAGFFNMALQAEGADSDIESLNRFLQLLGIQTGAAGVGQSTAPPSYLGTKVTPPANERRGSAGSYTIADLVSICRAAGFVGESAATAAAIAYATSQGFYKTVKEIGGVTKYGLWQLDKFDAPSLTVKTALDPLACAKLYYQLTINGTDFKISPQYNTGAYQKYMQAAKNAVNGPDTNVVISGNSNTTVTSTGSRVISNPSQAAGFGISTASGNDQYLDSQMLSIPNYGSNPSTDLMKSIYGNTEEEVRANLTTVNFQGHQIQVHKKVAGAFEAVDKQLTALNLGYQVRMVGTFDWRPKNNGSGTSELSLHSFGIAIDINWDTNGFGDAGVGPSGQHDIPDQWIQVFKSAGFGWGGDWGGDPSSKDYMHFQYEGGGSYSANGVATNSILGQNAFQSGVFQYLFNGADGVAQQAANTLIGDRAPINDQQLLSTIQAISSGSMRNFMSGPDGSFVAFFPDYFGLYGTSATFVLEDIEMLDFRVDASDDNLTTDVFVAGATNTFSPGGGNITLTEWYTTEGIVNIRQRNKMLYALGVDIENDPDFNPAKIYQRFGMRPLKAEFPNVGAHIVERSQALMMFMQKWAQQYSTNVSFTFMPELYPGMRILIKSHQMTVYVEEVVHSFGYDTGFTTSATISAPSTVGDRNESLILPVGRV
jgi:hypothetical protein